MHFRLRASPGSTGVRDVTGWAVVHRPASIAAGIWLEIDHWVCRYESAYRVCEGLHRGNIEAVRGLDREGLLLARRLETELGSLSKVQYWSEALLCSVDDESILDHILDGAVHREPPPI